MSGQSNKNQYETLYGDKPRTPLRWAFFTAADFKAGALATLGYGLYGSYTNDPAMQEDTSHLLLYNIFASLFVRGMERIALVGDRFELSPNQGFSAEELKEKVINKNPTDKERQASVSKYGLKIRRSQFLYGLFLGVQTLFTGVHIGRLMVNPSDNGALSPPLAVAGANVAYIARTVNGLRRFNKLASGEWAIVDRPKPEEVKEGAFEPLPMRA